MSLYTYQIDYGAGWVSATPEGEWTITPTCNEGQIFFRNIFEGDLTFGGTDYTAIMASTDCEVLEFRILCNNVEYWVGQFKFPYDLTIDEDTCTLVGTPEVVDEYSCIMDLYEVEYEDNMAVGGIQPIINDCAGTPLLTLNFAYRLFGSTASGFNSHIKEIVNGAGTMNCGLTLSSSFFSLSNFPNGDNYAAAYGTNNYITGATNRLRDIFLLYNSRMRQSFGGTACEPTLPSRSFKFLEEILRIAFNAYWYIDQNGHFRIEHAYFFDPAFPNSDFDVGADLTTLISNNGKSYAYRRNKYTYETGELYDQEKWTWQHYYGTEGTVAHGSDFQGVPVYYGAAVDQKSDCVPGAFKEKEHALPKVWTDIDWGYALRTGAGAGTPDTIECNNGYFMVDVTTATGHINCEVGAYSGVNGMNRHVSTANLQDHYHTYERIFTTGSMNGGGASPVVAFDSAIRTQLQEPIEFPICCDDVPDPLNVITTELGDGKVKSMKINQNSVEVELLY